VETAAELEQATARAFEYADVLLMAAAVADFRPADGGVDDKLKKEGREGLSLELAPTNDVLSALAEKRRPGQVLVGFAAEYGAAAVANARDKLERKRLDAVVVNDISRPGIGFDAADNEVTIVTGDGDQAVPRASKEEVARTILDRIEMLRTSGEETASEEEVGSA
jgi:phosphopantothenoylcysteine decarboxylase / phosphopantothenate---cysteine ligase